MGTFVREMPRWKRFVIEMSKDGIEKRSGICIGKQTISRISKLVSQRDVVTFVCLTIVVEEESPCVKELEIVDLVQIWFIWLKNFNTPSRSAIAVWIRCYQPMMIRLNLISLLIGTLLLSMSDMVAPLSCEVRGSSLVLTFVLSEWYVLKKDSWYRILRETSREPTVGWT